MVDPDGDTLKCRWAVGKECDSICNGVPVATLDEVNKTMTIMYICARNIDFASFYDVSIDFLNSVVFNVHHFMPITL